MSEIRQPVGSTDPSLTGHQTDNDYLQGMAPEVIDAIGAETVIGLESRKSAISAFQELEAKQNPFSMRGPSTVDLSPLDTQTNNEVISVFRREKKPAVITSRRPGVQRQLIKVGKSEVTRIGDASRAARKAYFDFAESEMAELKRLDEEAEDIEISRLLGAYDRLSEIASSIPNTESIRMVETIWKMIEAFGDKQMRKVDERSVGTLTKSAGAFFKFSRKGEVAMLHMMQGYIAKYKNRCEKLVEFGSKDYANLQIAGKNQQLGRSYDLMLELEDVQIQLYEQFMSGTEADSAKLISAENYLLDMAQALQANIKRVFPKLIEDEALHQASRSLSCSKISKYIERQQQATAGEFKQQIAEANDILVGGRRLKATKGVDPRDLITKLDRLTAAEKEKNTIEKALVAAILTGKFDSFVQTINRIKSSDERDGPLAVLRQNRPQIVQRLASIDLDARISNLEGLLIVYGDGLEALLGSEQLAKIKLTIDRYFGREVAEPQPTGATVGRDKLLELVFKQRELIGELDWTVLPKPENGDSNTLEEVAREIVAEAQERAAKGKHIEIDLNRLNILKNLRDYWGKDRCEYFRGKLRNKGSSANGDRPDEYIVLVMKQLDSHGNVVFEHAVAESPIAGGEHAIYVLRGDAAAGTWREIYALPKQDARSLGARKLMHTKGDGRPMVELLTNRARALLDASPEDFFRIKFDRERIRLRKIGGIALLPDDPAKSEPEKE